MILLTQKDHTEQASLGVWRWINKAVKLGAPFPVQGRWGLPFMYRRPMMIVFGKPLFAKEGETVSDFHERWALTLCPVHSVRALAGILVY